MMRNTRDTFLHFLADNLTSYTVHPIRRDQNDPSASVLQMNSVNVTFMGINPNVQISEQRVAIDIVADTELVATDMLEAVWNLLKSAFYTPQLDYTNPAAPVNTGTNIMWPRDKVSFTTVASDYYYQFSCVLSLQFHI